MHGSKNPDHKPTRVRTVLNEKQLQTLRTCYNANPRPDALMKEQLVEITGLSPRVIRVWYCHAALGHTFLSLMLFLVQVPKQTVQRQEKEHPDEADTAARESKCH